MEFLQLTKTISAVGILFLFTSCYAPNTFAQMVTGRAMTNFGQAFGLSAGSGVSSSEPKSLAAVFAGGTAPGNILWPGDKPTFDLKVSNRTNLEIEQTAKVDIISYGTKGTPGDVWTPVVEKIANDGSVPIVISLPPFGSQSITIAPDIPERFGAYALVADFGSNGGRQFLVSCVRTFKPSSDYVQYPALSLDDLGPVVLSRLGVHAIRWGISYKPTTDPDFEKWYQYRCF